MRKKFFTKRKLLQKALPFFVTATLLVMPKAGAETYTVANADNLLIALNAASNGDTVLLTNSGSNWVVPSSLTVAGNGGFTLDGGNVIILGNNTFRILDLTNKNIDSINNIEKNLGGATGTGGALTVNSIMGSVYNSAFRNNTATTDGGAIFVQSDFLGDIRTNIHFDSNRANGGSGGGLYIGNNFNGAIVGQNGDVHFDNNHASAYGGGMYVGGSFNNGQITATYFATNQSGLDGGGLYVKYNFNGSLAAYSFFINNTAGQDGAGLYTGGDFNGQINGARVTGNSAGRDGGGIYIAGNINSTVTADFENNAAINDGGALYVGRDFNANISGSSFISNQATGGNGGAIYSGQNMNNQWENSTFRSNSAVNGGAVYSQGTINSSMNNLTFTSNSATSGSGGAIYAGGYLAGSTTGGDFSSNTASNDGGAIYVGQDLNGGFQNTQFTSNSAGNGGAIYTNGYLNGYLDNITFNGNNATGGNGGAIAANNDFRGNITSSNFSNNAAAGMGGALYAATDLTSNIQDTTFQSNSAAQGGAIYITNIFGGNLQSLDFVNNHATSGNGGAIAAVNNFSPSVNQVNFKENTATGSGGALYTTALHDINFNQVIFSGNQAATGGAIATNSIDNLTYNGVSFTNNSATAGTGGAISTNSYAGEITADFTSNSASLAGGAVYIGSDLTGSIHDNNFTGNKAGTDGGAISVQGLMSGGISNSTLTNNTAGSSGGALNVVGALNGGINNTILTNNTAGTEGGAISVQDLMSGGISNSTLTNNTAGSSGGGVSVVGALNGGINNTILTNNTAGTEGGAISVQDLMSGGISNSTLTNNTAGTDGGAVYALGLTGDVSGSTIRYNKASGLGGGLYIENDLNVSVGDGLITIIRDNTDSSGTNSIAFAGGNKTANFAVDGQLVMYDPVSSVGSVAVTKTGSGSLVLGGNSVMGADSNWRVESGSMKLTFDTQGNSFSMSGLETFYLEEGAVLEVVPYATPAQIMVTSTGTIDLNGKVNLVSDYRYAPQLTITDETIFLHLSQPHLDEGLIEQTSGTFSVGQYDYSYEDIVWINNDTDVSFKQLDSWVSPDRNGGNNVDGSMNVSVSNDTSKQVFAHLDSLLVKNEEQREIHRNFWGTTFYNMTKTDPKNRSAGSSVEVPGLILGYDFGLSANSYIGTAVSAAWPKYRQNGFQDKGYDIRFNLYGGTFFAGDWKFSWLASAGFGNLKHSRYVHNEQLSEKRDISNYVLGISLGREIEYKPKNILHPFITYEYIMSKAKGFEENGHDDYAIGTSKINADISRLRIGLEYIRHFNEKSKFKVRLYYQGLYGDTNPQGVSYMLSDPSELVTMVGAGLDRNALGTGITFTKAFNARSSLSFDYDGIFASNSKSNNFSLTYEYKF